MARGEARIALVGMALLLLSACGSSTSGTPTPKYKTIQSGLLTVATYGTAVPIIVVGPGDQLGGTAGAWITAFANDSGLKLKLFQTTFASSILAVQQGKADMSVSFYWNADRAKTVYYTYPLDIEGLQVFTKKSFSYSGPTSLNGKKVGTVAGYEWVPNLQKAFGSNLLVYPTETEGKTAFLNDQIVAYFDAGLQFFGPPLNADANTVALHNVSPGDFGIPGSLITVMSYNIVSCNEKDLAKGLDDELSKLQSSGKWADILNKTGAPAGSLPATAAPLVHPDQGC